MRRLVLLAALAVTGPGACRAKETGDGSRTAKAGDSSAAPVPPPSASKEPGPGGERAPSAVLRAPTEACRAIRVTGDVRGRSGAKVEAGAPIDGAAWLSVGPKAELAIKHAITAREMAFRGPGRLRACPRGEERLIFASGRASATPGPGARPGAEVLFATPAGVVRFGDAKLSLDLGERGLELSVETGTAWLEGPLPGDLSEQVDGGKQARRTLRPVDVKALLGGCEAAATASEAKARDVLGPAPPGRPLGERAQEHVRARQAARIACAAAESALGAIETRGTNDGQTGQQAGQAGGALDSDLELAEQALARAEAKWRGVPSRRAP